MKRAADEHEDEDARPPPALRLTLSPNFQPSDADIELRSIDGVRFLVHKANLASGSRILGDMLVIGSDESTELREGGRPVLQLTESGVVLERVLPYFYPKGVPLWKLDLPDDLEIIGTFDKYEVMRGVDAVAAAFHHIFDGGPGKAVPDRRRWPEFGDSVLAYAFAMHFDYPTLASNAMDYALEAAAAAIPEGDGRCLSFWNTVDWGPLGTSDVKEQFNEWCSGRLRRISQFHVDATALLHKGLLTHSHEGDHHDFINVLNDWDLSKERTTSSLPPLLPLLKSFTPPCKGCATAYLKAQYEFSESLFRESEYDDYDETKVFVFPPGPSLF